MAFWSTYPAATEVADSCAIAGRKSEVTGSADAWVWPCKYWTASRLSAMRHARSKPRLMQCFRDLEPNSPALCCLDCFGELARSCRYDKPHNPNKYTGPKQMLLKPQLSYKIPAHQDLLAGSHAKSYILSIYLLARPLLGFAHTRSCS